MSLFKKLKSHGLRNSLRLPFSKTIAKNAEVPPQQLKLKKCTPGADVEQPATIVYGQPTFRTHPHLIAAGDLVPGIAVSEFRQRRERLMSAIQKFTRDNTTASDAVIKHILIVPSSTKKYMSGKIPYFFRQNSDFYYLTGCLEPDSALLLEINDSDKVTSTLFMREKDRHAELWDGARTGVENAIKLFGVQKAYPVNQFSPVLAGLMSNKGKTSVWYDMDGAELDTFSRFVNQSASTTNTQLHSPGHFLQSLRLFKSPAEMALMRRTCQIASEAINEVMAESRPGQTEHQLYASVDYKCRMRNASHLAYPPVVAAGNNATTIHYINNTQMTRDGDMVLMDAGCEYGGYTSDITRTWPIGGNFTPPQKILYDVVLQLQKDIISMIMKPGGETLDKLFDAMCLQLGKYLQEVGLVPKELTNERDLVQEGFKFCPHHVSHYLGMDVHDTPEMPRSLRILPGMVFTVEPGIYIGHERTDVPSEYRGIGVRIEDDLLIDADNNVEVLTATCTKERSAIETMLKRTHAAT